jgi:hypothetical protein
MGPLQRSTRQKRSDLLGRWHKRALAPLRSRHTRAPDDQPIKQLIEGLVIITSPLVIPSPKNTIEKTLELLKQAFPQEKEFLNSITGFKEFTKTSLSKQSQF